MGRPLLATLALAACAGVPAAQGATLVYLCRLHDPLLGADAEQTIVIDFDTRTVNDGQASYAAYIDDLKIRWVRKSAPPALGDVVVSIDRFTNDYRVERVGPGGVPIFPSLPSSSMTSRLRLPRGGWSAKEIYPW